MKNKILKTCCAGLLVLFSAGSCSDDVLDRIDTNPNSPTDVSTRLLLAQATAEVAFAVTGTDLAWYSSVFVEHTTGVHGQLENADKRVGINSTIANNSWNTIYAGTLKDLDVIIEKGSTGSEAGSWTTVGIAKILKAYVYSIATDLWGKVPFSQALQGNANRKPVYDNQQDIYAALQTLLDEAIADLDKTSIGNPGTADLFNNGNAASWKKAAWGLKARFYNRLSKREPAESANKALAALQNSFTTPGEGLIFSKFTTAAIGENPWFQELNDRSHHAVSNTFYNLLTESEDPRAAVFFGEVRGRVVPATNGSAQSDQAGTIYSRASNKVVFATAAIPIITFEEVKFIEAEANLRLGNTQAAYAAYRAGVNAALAKAGVAAAAATAYTAQPEVFMGAANLTLADIIEQKYISFWIYQPIEAYNDWRRTGFPTLTNTIGPPPRRFPYPKAKLTAMQRMFRLYN